MEYDFMIKIDEGKVVLESRVGVEFENGGVLNPTCVEKDGVLHMFYRAVRKENFSTIGYCQMKDNKVVYRADNPILVPEYDYEKKGLEDPRITFFEGKYYMLYTAYDGKNALVAYATSSDLKTWEKKGVISSQMSYDRAEDIFKKNKLDRRYSLFERWFRFTIGDNIKLWEKDATLFPKRINGKMAMIHRVLPGIQICYFDKFTDLNNEYWEKYLANLDNYIILDPQKKFESGYIGGGCAPIETDEGWLLIYHGVDIENNQRIYRVGAMLLDINNPQKVIGRLPYPLFSPKATWEKQGVVDNVVFPTGAIVKDDLLSIYYGAADTKIGVRTLSLSKLIKELSL
jgi:beta-1,2-mannobiose phosphorylase / 1,2-beta-oligomannan phosphorylase